MEIEYKSFAFDFSLNDSEAPGTIEGYGAVFGNMDSWGDIIEPAAFKEVKCPLPMLWQHDTGSPVGVWNSAVSDEHGLKMRGNLLIEDVVQAKEAYALIKSGAITGLSIGYVPVNYFYDAENCRHLSEIKLFEVSLVTFPANEQALLTSVKSDDLTIRKAEKALVSAGFSHRQAKEILSKGFRSVTDRDEQADQRDADVKTLEKARLLLDIFK